ncbi:Uncharacterized protein VB005_01658 [Metarhizium brunneum]
MSALNKLYTWLANHVHSDQSQILPISTCTLIYMLSSSFPRAALINGSVNSTAIKLRLSGLVKIIFLTRLKKSNLSSSALSVLKQYLAACDAYGFRPWYLQADRGRETPLVAAAHWNFALAADGRVEWHGQVFQQGKRLRDSYKAGPSTKNVKIESWWEQMLHVSSRQWVDYFGELARDGDFDGEMLEDQIAIYAVFEDVLRQELFDFVEAWNLHRIRLQKNRPCWDHKAIGDAVLQQGCNINSSLSSIQGRKRRERW